jgi:Fe-S-cluster-containing dehydrogenase component
MGGLVVVKYGMIVDVSRCTGCYSCFLACRDEYCGNDFPPLSASQPNSGQFWMNIQEIERGKFPKVKVAYIPIPCLHCRNAACIEASLNNAVYRRDDGIVIIDPEKAVGQEAIVSACPHRVIYWNREKHSPQKCTFCAHLLDGGEKIPRCVEACPTGALVFGDLNDPDSAISKIKALKEIEELHPEYGLEPLVYYAHLPKRFIAGEVILDDRKDECAVNVDVILVGGKTRMSKKTDSFGDFEFEGLRSDTDYTVRVEYPGYASKDLSVKTRTDINLGEIVLTRV